MKNLLLALGACASLAACAADTTPAADPGGRVAIDVQALSLDGVDDVVYTLAVRNESGDLVWSRQVDADGYGDGVGSLTYVGTCDAEDDPNGDDVALNSVSLVIDRVVAGGVELTAGVDFMNPAPTGDPLVRAVPCTPNADASAAFDVTLARRANQGFFDIAIELDDVFCSAKLDCESAPGTPLRLLTDPVSGARGVTAVVGFACTAGGGQSTWLHLDDVAVSCTGGGGFSATVPVAAGPGQLNPAYAGASDELLFQTAIYRDVEQLAGYAKGYWNVALGLNTGAFTTLGPCTLTGAGTASSEPLDNGHTPAGMRYPLVRWSAPLVAAGGALTCASHGLGEGSEVVVDYTPTAGHGFSASWEVGAATPSSPVLAAPTITGATATTEDVVGSATITFTSVAGADGAVVSCDGGASGGVLTATVGAGVTSATVTGLALGVAYGCTVSATAGATTSEPSAPATVTATTNAPEFLTAATVDGNGWYDGALYPGDLRGLNYELGTRGGRFTYVNPATDVNTGSHDYTVVASDALAGSFGVDKATDRDGYAGRLEDDDAAGLTVTWTFAPGLAATLDGYWLKYANFGAGTTLEAQTAGGWEVLRTWAATTTTNRYGEAWGAAAPSGPVSAVRLVIAAAPGATRHRLAEIELFGAWSYPAQPGPVESSPTTRFLSPLHGIFWELGTLGGTETYANPTGRGSAVASADVIVAGYLPYTTLVGDPRANAGTTWTSTNGAATITWELLGGRAVVDPTFFWGNLANVSAGTTLDGWNGTSWVTLHQWVTSPGEGGYEAWFPITATGTFTKLRMAFPSWAGTSQKFHAVREIELFGTLIGN
ncbi:MAG: hypothetical protein H6745_33175 [Deltaproteobacteria bacterium]|nr:hypothetical protein [Deltaproteobacteria bacterium]